MQRDDDALVGDIVRAAEHICDAVAGRSFESFPGEQDEDILQVGRAGYAVTDFSEECRRRFFRPEDGDRWTSASRQEVGGGRTFLNLGQSRWCSVELDGPLANVFLQQRVRCPASDNSPV